jgi:hypothetical protein
VQPAAGTRIAGGIAPSGRRRQVPFPWPPTANVSFARRKLIIVNRLPAFAIGSDNFVHTNSAAGSWWGNSPAAGGSKAMNMGWILLGIVGWALGLVVLLALLRMSGDQDRAARHEQKRLHPYSDVTITQLPH